MHSLACSVRFAKEPEICILRWTFCFPDIFIFLVSSALHLTLKCFKCCQWVRRGNGCFRILLANFPAKKSLSCFKYKCTFCIHMCACVWKQRQPLRSCIMLYDMHIRMYYILHVTHVIHKWDIISRCKIYRIHFMYMYILCFSTIKLRMLKAYTLIWSELAIELVVGWDLFASSIPCLFFIILRSGSMPRVLLLWCLFIWALIIW